jgi:hypothetical protein
LNSDTVPFNDWKWPGLAPQLITLRPMHLPELTDTGEAVVETAPSSIRSGDAGMTTIWI